MSPDDEPLEPVLERSVKARREKTPRTLHHYVMYVALAVALLAFAESARTFMGFAENDGGLIHLGMAFLLCFGAGGLIYMPAAFIALAARQFIKKHPLRTTKLMVFLLVGPWVFLCVKMIISGGKLSLFGGAGLLLCLFFLLWAIRLPRLKKL